METLTAIWMASGHLFWRIEPIPIYETEEGVAIEFPYSERVPKRGLLKGLREELVRNEIRWLKDKGGFWELDVDELRASVDGFPAEAVWLSGKVAIVPEIEEEPRHVLGGERLCTVVRFGVYKEEYYLKRPQRIFLSHRGTDKGLVRRFYEVLNCLGFDAWLDEEAMPAGSELNRGILQGFEDSCAVVFFVTPSFEDERYLREEVDHAVDQKRRKGDRFAIITLVIADAQGRRGKVPDLLRRYVYKEPASELDALKEILRALPIEVGLPRWREDG